MTPISLSGLASPQTSFGVRLSRIHFSKDVCGEAISGPHIVYYTLRFTFFFTTVLLGDVSHFQTSGTFTKKPYKKKVHNILLVGLVVRFVQISSIYITSQGLKRVY